MRKSATKVGRYPLQKTGGEKQEGWYESADYLYAYHTGFVWLRTVHDLKTNTHQLCLEVIFNGIKFNQWLPPVEHKYTERQLCHQARTFAKSKAQ